MSCSHVIRGAVALLGVLVAAQSMAASPEEGLICRYEARPGSRMLSHPCLTQAQWAEIDKREAAVRGLLGASSVQQGDFAATTPVSTAQTR